MRFAPSNNPELVEVPISMIRNNIKLSCNIITLDIQACYCGRPESYSDPYLSDNTDTCVAYEFYKKQEITRVFAWTGKCKYMKIAKGSFSKNGGKFVEIIMRNGKIDSREVETKTKFMGLYPSYKPLQY